MIVLWSFLLEIAAAVMLFITLVTFDCYMTHNDRGDYRIT